MALLSNTMGTLKEGVRLAEDDLESSSVAKRMKLEGSGGLVSEDIWLSTTNQVNYAQIISFVVSVFQFSIIFP